MKLVPINSIFDIKYGNQLNLNEMVVDNNGINFISRSSQNLGLSEIVKRIGSIEPFEAGLLTVTLGGTYLLGTFVQPKPFYTAQNIKVLKPKQSMTFEQKMFYCKVIELNRFRYTSHGREANTTFDSIIVPDVLESKVIAKKLRIINSPSVKSFSDKQIKLSAPEYWKSFQLIDYFEMFAGRYYRADSYCHGKTPLISASDNNNGTKAFTNLQKRFDGNSLTVGKIGASAYYQPIPFVATSDVTVLTPNIPFNQYIGVFIATVINCEKFRWNYGRQIRLNDCQSLKIKLPANSKGNPDWQFMEDYIKSLPYSKNL